MPILATDPAGARELIEGAEPWTIVDVRSPEEFAAGHVPGAFNVPIAFRGPMGMEFNPAFVATIRRHFEIDSRLLLACAAGIRSLKACELLVAEGFEQVANMNGGMSGGYDTTGTRSQPGWQEQGFPVTQEPDPERTWAVLGEGS